MTKPCFETGLGKLYKGDAMKILDELKDELYNRVDLILTDPPYNISQKGKVLKRNGKWKAKDIILDFGEWDYNKLTPYEWIPKVYDLLTDNGILIFFYNKMEISCIAKWLEEELDMKVRHIGAMIKTNPTPQMVSKSKWANGTELFIIATKNKGQGHHFNWKMGHHADYIVTSVASGKERYPHPTQKPQTAIAVLLKYWSFENDLVLDPFAGTGTTLYVAEKMKRRWVGIEINEEYVNMIIDRFSKNVPIKDEPVNRLERIYKKYDYVDIENQESLLKWLSPKKK